MECGCFRKDDSFMLKLKIVSNLEKVLANGRFDDYAEISHLSVLKGERISFQVACEMLPQEPDKNFSLRLTPALEGTLAKYAKVRQVRHVPATNNGRGTPDDDYITTAPAILPDVLAPLPYEGILVLPPSHLVSLWVDVEIPADAEEVGESTLAFSLSLSWPKEEVYRSEITLDVIDAVLPKQPILFAQWLHADCLADYYRVPQWSDEHFKIIRRFAATGKKNGFNFLYVPLISPPLDNEADKRDLQLAEITCQNGEYTFGWKNLDRFLDIANEVGIEYFEIGHLFTQGGAARATKAMGMKDGEYCRLFSKDTPSDDPGYTAFLRAMLTSFLTHMKERGEDKRCYFHISDEPMEEHLEAYQRAKESIADLLDGYPIMDALSHYEFYRQGVVKKPIVLLNFLGDFLDHGVEGLWAYNCCGPDHGYSNRFLAMTLARNRSICLLLYKFRIEGFLHWGYNFYNNSSSGNHINPFLDTGAGDNFPSGDPFSVYPGEGGEPWESMRLLTFHEALQDLSAFHLCESLYSRDEVVAVLEEEIGAAIAPTTYLNDAARMQAVRERINAMIRARVGG